MIRIGLTILFAAFFTGAFVYAVCFVIHLRSL